MGEISRKSEDRLQHLENRLQERTTEAVVSSSTGSQVPLAAQAKERPVDTPLPHIRQSTTPPTARPANSIQAATKKDLQE